MTQQPDYYRVLGVSPTSEDVVIRAAYKAMMLKYHPDTYKGDPQEGERKAKELNEAYEVLGDPARRAEYDARMSRASGRAGRAQSEGQSSAGQQSAGRTYSRPNPPPPSKPERVRVGWGKDFFRNAGLALVALLVIGAIGNAVNQKPSPAQDASPAPAQTPAQQLTPAAPMQTAPSAPQADQAVAPAPLPQEPTLDPDRLFRPQDSFTVAGGSDQSLMRSPLPNSSGYENVGSISVANELPVSEIYQDTPTSFTIWYHVQGGWVQGRLDEFTCANCGVHPVTRSDRDALTEDDFLLRTTARALGPGPSEFRPGAAQMQDKCNIVANPFTVNRQHRSPWVGYYMRDGQDVNLLSDAPALQAGETVNVDNMIVAPGNTMWIHVTTSDTNPDAQQGWVSTMCVVSNTQ